jgi:hypothetical protein
MEIHMANQDLTFANSTVISTRRDSSIPGVVLRRRQAADGTRFTTAEVSEAMLELLLSTPGGLKRRNTAINPENIAKAVELSKSGKTRAEQEAEMGVSAGTFRRLLAAAGVDSRKYNPVLTDENVTKAVAISVRYDLGKRRELMAAAKELGVNSRTMRRLLSRAVTDLGMEKVAEIRAAEKQRLADEAGQLSLEVTNVATDAPDQVAGQVQPDVAPAPDAVGQAPAAAGGDAAGTADVAPAETATLVAVANDGTVIAEAVTPATVAEAVVAATAAMPPEPNVPGTPDFVERRANPPVSPEQLAAVAAAAATAAVAAVVHPTASAAS